VALIKQLISGLFQKDFGFHLPHDLCLPCIGPLSNQEGTFHCYCMPLQVYHQCQTVDIITSAGFDEEF